MYRLLLILVIVSLSESWRDSGYSYSYRNNRRWRYNRYDREFTNLARHVIEADRSLQKFCKQNANCNVRETYENDGYKLVYFLPQCSVDYIAVKIKHRVLYMSAQQVFVRSPKTYVDMRILPDLLRLRDAKWTYSDGKLEIYIPYSVNFKSEFEATCGSVNTRVIRVKQAGYITDRFGEDEVDYSEEIETEDATTEPEGTVTENSNATSTEAVTTNDNADKLIFSS